jgi:hypothetical protein
MCLGLSWLSYNLEPLCLVLVVFALVCMRKLLSFVLALFHLRLILKCLSLLLVLLVTCMLCRIWNLHNVLTIHRMRTISCVKC